ncbi:hypothetical protein SALBM135S_09778 [Streptomyces alboniger]
MSTDTFRYAEPTVQSPRVLAHLSQYGSLTSTVPKELVHRAAVAEVLLTGWERRDEAHFTVTAQWPRGHSFFTPVNGTHYDPLMVTETIRQVGSLLAHAEFDVPLGHQFLMRDLEVAVRPQYLGLEGVPASLELDVTYTEVKQRRHGHAGARYEAVVRRDGHIVATGGAAYTCVGPEVYQRLRGSRSAAHARCSGSPHRSPRRAWAGCRPWTSSSRRWGSPPAGSCGWPAVRRSVAHVRRLRDRRRRS